ncbi:hypothetical protein H9P43_008532 [Blastocladiella emersonii ATCC 22665]|nr:hypothetical protein H9P43_008532 [Blastocladiella emersonii ATCC 22665]
MSTTAINSKLTAVGPKDLWTIMKEEGAAVRASEGFDLQSGSETSIMFLGQKSSGKSSIIHRFLDKSDVPSATVGLEYTYGRRTRATTNVKDVSHIWDLGGGTHMTKLLQVPLTAGNVHTAAAVVCVDLSRPRELVAAMEHFVTALAMRVEEILGGLEKRGSKRPKGLRAFAAKRYGGDHPDRATLKLIPVTWALVCTKYDAFRDQPSELRRAIVRLVRYVGHVYGGTIIFTSDRADEATATRMKQLVSHYTFKTTPPKQETTDPNRAVYLIPGSDSFEDIFANTAYKTVDDIKAQIQMLLSKSVKYSQPPGGQLVGRCAPLARWPRSGRSPPRHATARPPSPLPCPPSIRLLPRYYLLQRVADRAEASIPLPERRARVPARTSPRTSIYLTQT